MDYVKYVVEEKGDWESAARYKQIIDSGDARSMNFDEFKDDESREDLHAGGSCSAGRYAGNDCRRASEALRLQVLRESAPGWSTTTRAWTACTSRSSR